MTSFTTSIPILPGNWLGMMGGGQLGRMFCHAAQAMGYKVAVLDPAGQCPAGVVADRHIRARYDDRAGLDQLADLCRAVTTEFENVPADSLDYLAKRCRVSPAGAAVAVAQDRIREKAFIRDSGADVASYAEIHSSSDVDAAPDAVFPGILKAARLGYDGKGQVRVKTRSEARAAFDQLGGVPCVLEAMESLAREISIVVVRGVDGESVVYPASRNEHRGGILAISIVDAQGNGDPLHARASAVAKTIADRLDYQGVLCVEFFVVADGRLVVNEMAPRPHNSGHYTIDACVASQFEQQARVMAGLPLGSTDCLCSSVMLNILGDVWFDDETGTTPREPDWAAVLAEPGAKLHLYGKADARRGRKMGHITCLGASLADARRSAANVARALRIPFQG